MRENYTTIGIRLLNIINKENYVINSIEECPTELLMKSDVLGVPDYMIELVYDYLQRNNYVSTSKENNKLTVSNKAKNELSREYRIPQNDYSLMYAEYLLRTN